jgi:hypothetical protein
LGSDVGDEYKFRVGIDGTEWSCLFLATLPVSNHPSLCCIVFICIGFGWRLDCFFKIKKHSNKISSSAADSKTIPTLLLHSIFVIYWEFMPRLFP